MYDNVYLNLITKSNFSTHPSEERLFFNNTWYSWAEIDHDVIICGMFQAV